MDNKYSAELVRFSIDSLSIDVDFAASQTLEITANAHYSMSEPVSGEDNTVKVNCETEMTDKSNSLIIKLSSQSIFEFNPIPDNWIAAVRDICPPHIHEEIILRTEMLLRNMGYDIKMRK